MTECDHGKPLGLCDECSDKPAPDLILTPPAVPSELGPLVSHDVTSNEAAKPVDDIPHYRQIYADAIIRKAEAIRRGGDVFSLCRDIDDLTAIMGRRV